jgi:sigma-B regulation protein RsbU (phosphoserine phosphatase)
MLEQVVATYEADFEKLAHSWLAEGAFSFGVRSFGQSLAQWSRIPGNGLVGTSIPISCGDLTLGELYVTGLAGESVETQLKSEAVLISRMIALEGELESLTTELVDSQDQLVALYDLVHSTRNLVSVPEIIRGLVQAVGQIFAVETAFIWAKLPEREQFLAEYPHSLAEDSVNFLVQQTLIRQNYFLSNGSLTTSLLIPKNINNALAIPLAIRGKKAAVLGLVNKLDSPFESPVIKMLRAIGHYAESQIENALTHEINVEQARVQTRFQTEMELARHVQMNLMPQKLPQIEGLDLAGAARPALSVGGDYYDCLLQPNGELYFTLGDVSGKGMSAALLMAMTRTTMRNAARLLAQSSPRTILDRTNEALYDDFTDVGMFATVFTGTYCLQEGRLSYANAGHVPVIYRPAKGSACLIEATGAPIGVLPQNVATECTIPFGEGDLLIIATDGFNEARNKQGEMFDYDRLLRLVDELADCSAAEILQGLFTAVSQFSQGQPQEDDQTIMIMKRIKI